MNLIQRITITTIVGKNPFKEREWPSLSTRVWNAILGYNLKMTERSVCFHGKSFNITVIQVHAPTTDSKEAEVDQFYEKLQQLLELATKKMPFSSED